MNLRDALIAGSEHGTDRLSIEADRRLRRRLGLESAATRRVWLVPAFAFAAVAAVALLVVWQTRSNPTVQATTKQAWAGALTADTLDVFANSSASATVTWFDAAITAAPGTKLSRRDAGLVLAQGSIQITRTDVKPLVVTVPMGRVVLAAYRSSIKADRETATILIDDGSAQFIDAAGNTQTLVPGVPLVAPPVAAPPGTAPPPPVEEAPAPPRPTRPAQGPPSTVTPPPPPGPPGVTPPIVRPDVPCTFKSDCDPGATCRKNESGVSVCMGNGGEGAACWFDNDCVSNLCVSRRCAP